ncbi:unnamed protein product [Dicrocoelium dendriticum]|nr:unnamed protein product [Dicrocoelium dendriticum]
MAVATVAKNVIRFGTCIGAVYYSVAEGVWSTSDQSVGPASKVKHRLLPQTFTFINDLPYRICSTWNHYVSVTFDALKNYKSTACSVKKYVKSFRSNN